MQRKNLPGFGNPLRRPLPVVLDPIGRAALLNQTTNMVRRPILNFGGKKGMKIGFA
jgi:hypothetical protein